VNLLFLVNLCDKIRNDPKINQEERPSIAENALSTTCPFYSSNQDNLTANPEDSLGLRFLILLKRRLFVMQIVNPERYQSLVAEAQTAGFSGWDFSWLEGRMLQEEPPWDYPEIIRSHIKSVQTLLDLGTGGGELLASLLPLPPQTHATEAYPPNQAIARKRLEPLGVTVHDVVDGEPLPFNEEVFDLVISRHESFDPREVDRILKPDGTFIIQQVGGLNNLELNQVLEDDLTSPYSDWGLASALTGLSEADFLIERAEKATLKSTFLDIGAIVYYLKAIPWQVEGFSPETHSEKLVQIHNIIERQGEFVATAHRFLIIAKKKGVEA